MRQTNMFCISGQTKFTSKLSAFALAFLLLLSPIAPVLAEGAEATTPPSAAEQPISSLDSSTSDQTSIVSPSDPNETNANSKSAIPIKEDNMAAMSSATQPLYTENMTVDLTENKKGVLKTDEVTGALNYSYPISIPPGRNGLQPDLQLNYNNQQANNYPNLFGYGWNISIPYIDRINKLGTDKLYTSNYFNSSLSGELVLVSGTTYAPKVENGDFLTYTYDGISWTVKDKKGTTYKFGQNAQSKQDDSTGVKIYKWMLEEVRDTNNNFVTYTYFKDAGQIYPSVINYSGIFEVDFLRESRVDINKSYATTFLITTNYRISEIQTKVNGAWVRKYNFAYTTGDNGVRSLLLSITESGRDENSAVTTLPATVFEYQTHPSGWTYDGSASFPEDFNTGSYDGGVRMADLNRDGLPDVLLARSGGISGRKVYINKGANSWVFDPSWIIPEDFVWVPADNGLRPTDVNSDGLLDLLFSKTGSPQKTYLNSGANFSPDISRTLPEFFIEQNGEDKGVRIADINADGLPDILVAQDSNIPANKTYINTGSGFSYDSSWKLPEVFLVGRSDNGIRMGDVNGDGLLDILLSRDGIHKTYLNTGFSWTLDSSWTIPEDFVWSPYDKGLRLADINGDGMADLLYARSGAPRQVFINTGSSFINNPSWTIPENFIEGTTSTQTMIDDSDGDGLVDLIRADEYAPPRKIYKANSKFPDILSSITIPEGAVTTISYKPSTQYKDQNGNLLNPSLPLIIQTVEKIETDDGFDNKSAAFYEYSGGSYYFDSANPIDRKFAGFAKVTKIDGIGAKTSSYFHQGNDANSTQGEYNDHSSKIGKIYRVEVTDSFGNIYSKTINKWERFNLGTGRDFVKLVRSTTETFDGNATHRDTAEAYTYDDTTGNLISKINYGEVNALDDGSFTDIGADKFTENISYAANTLNNVIGLPSQDTLLSQAGNKIKESKMYYDNLALDSVGAGNNTKTENWKTGTTYINTQKTYNSFGSVTSVTDPRGKVTNYAYDTYNIYPATVTDPLTHTTQYQYDYSSGKPKQTIDQNGFVYQTVFDGLDRVLQEKIPDLISPYLPVVKTQYAYTDTPNNVSIQKTDYLDAVNSADSYQYFDGLNRKIQEKKEAEIGYSTKDYSYDNRGLLNKESLPYNSSSSARTTPTAVSGLYANYTYDPSQRMLSNSNAVGTTSYTYDDWKTTVTDANGKQKNYYQDAYDNLAKVEEINGGNIYATNYEWNGNKNLTKITDALGNVRNFTYDGLSRRLSAEDLHSPADPTFGTYAYTYDDTGNLTQTLDPKSQTINYTYDNLNRVLTEDYAGTAGAETTYTYDLAPNGIGKLSSVGSIGAGAIYSYDSLGRVNGEIKNINAVGYRTDYIYDRQNNNLEITNPDGSQVKYIYNSAGLLNQIQRKESADPGFNDVVSNFDYSPTEQNTVTNYTNGVTTTNTYDPAKFYRLVRKLTQNTTPANLQDLNYIYDPVGNITQIIDNSNTNSKKTADYVYDDLHRLISANYSGLPQQGGLPAQTGSTGLLQAGLSVFSSDLLSSIDSNTAPITKASSLFDKAKISSLFSAYIYDDFYRLASVDYSGLSAPSVNKAEINYFLSTVATPTITPNGGTFFAPQTVTLATTTIGATLFYTKNGATPATVAGGSTLRYTGPFSVTASQIIKVIAVRTGMNNSVVKSALFTIKVPVSTVATPTITPTGGIFTSAQTVVLTTATVGATLLYTKNGANPATVAGGSTLRYTGPFSVSSSQTIKTIAVKVGMNNSAMKSAVFTINIPVPTPTVATPTITPAGGIFTSAQTVKLTTTTIGATLLYTKNGAIPAAVAGGSTLLYIGPFSVSASQTIKAIAVKSGMNNSAVKSVTFTISVPVPTVATPTIAPNGGTFTSAQTITLTTTTTGASIFYTTDGTIPATIAGGSTLLYTAPFSISTTKTVKAIAIKSGMNNSAVSSAIFTINIPVHSVATPTITPAGGIYSAPQTITLATTTAGASIFYTTDGTTPVTSATGSTLAYTAPFNLESSATVKAIATKSGMNNSVITSGVFTINIPIPPSIIKSFSYNYDPLGNILTRTEIDINNLSTTYTYAYNGNTGTSYANPHAVTSITSAKGNTIYTYDKNGNLVTDGTWTNTWDHQNRLIQSEKTDTTISYAYDHTGQRIKLTNGATTTTYPNKFYNYDGTKKTKNIYAGNQLVSTIETVSSTITPYYILTDHLNSTNVVTDTAGNIAELLDYYPYGTIRLDEKTGLFSEQRKYIGQEYDANTSLSYLNARYYNSNIGKFISQDSMFWNPEKILQDSQSMNSYSYARNNPITNLDSDGKFWFVAPTIIGGVAGGLIGGTVSAISGNGFWQGAKYGAISGAVAGFTISTAGVGAATLGLTSTEALIGGSAVGNALGGVAARTAMGQNTNAGDVGIDLAVGGLGGMVGSGMGARNITVGRWMSDLEYSKMVKTGNAQEGGGGVTYVSTGGPESFSKQARSGSIYAEFGVPKNSLVQGGQTGQFKLVGGGANLSQITTLQKQGGQLLQNITVKNLSKILNKK